MLYRLIYEIVTNSTIHLFVCYQLIIIFIRHFIPAIDKVGHTSEVISEPVTVDVTPPEIVGNIDTSGAFHRTSHSIRLSWFGVFTDIETGMLLCHNDSGFFFDG